ncbi:sensor histidine kinase [Ulvibacterium marinum]|uniref:Histidine kinase n=1 Tax=Ulvibacterium marinum TaxID=2419782 RepID=A0A3B0C3G4_9FLAO|nr:histidine kinase [Ulvibacterium marinum]RKN80282.1 histidine kinase [Ulvibacterium marinum]
MDQTMELWNGDKRYQDPYLATYMYPLKENLITKTIKLTDRNENNSLFQKGIIFFEPFIIIAFWVLLFASPLLFSQFQDGVLDWNHILNIWKSHLSLLIVFLSHRLVLMPLLFFKGKRTIYFASVLAMLSVTTFLVYSFDDRMGRPQLPPNEQTKRPLENLSKEVLGQKPPPDVRPRRNNRRPIPFYANFLILAILLIGFDAGLNISIRWMGMEQEKFRLQKESVENQLAFLRNQVSPHFFMNTLNNIHALVDIDSEQAKQSIVKLSNLMRHLLYDSEERQNPIKKEVEFILSYIELMQLRFTDKVEIETDIPSKIPDNTIPPLLFTSLLENAFKHGISYNNPSFIRIVMSFAESRLNFYVENSNHSKNTKAPSGIGIENTRKRLDLLYKKEYDLTITEHGDKYAVNLSIPI